MLKRTIGRLLLTSLVITGLAGTLKTSSISKKERKQAIVLLKESRAQLINSIEGLSSVQIDYKSSPTEPSISEMVAGLIACERKCADEIKKAMEGSAEAEDRLKIALSDQQIIDKEDFILFTPGDSKKTSKKQVDTWDSLKRFAMMRNGHIKYLRNSTEDLRNHVIPTPAGWIDCYQYYLLLAGQSTHVAAMIEDIKSQPGFPK